ncbi:hypothetical protein [Nostoc spongiaeforme]|nr:hypothetical protein [Nostoc spongiaeforme]
MNARDSKTFPPAWLVSEAEPLPSAIVGSAGLKTDVSQSTRNHD